MNAQVRHRNGVSISQIASEFDLLTKLASDPKALVAKFEARALKPHPLRRLSFQELCREEEVVERLLLAAERANIARLHEIYEAEEEACLNEAITGKREALPEDLQRRPDHDYVVSQRLQDLLRLRLNLCRSEQSRRPFLRRSEQSSHRR